MTQCQQWLPLLTRLLVLLLWSPPHQCQHSDSSDPLAWLRYLSQHSKKNAKYHLITAVNTRESVRGSPGVDYPIYGMSAFSLSTFSCEDRAQGVHYADPGLGCQVQGQKLTSWLLVFFLRRFFTSVTRSHGHPLGYHLFVQTELFTVRLSTCVTGGGGRF